MTARTRIALINNLATPYRVALHRRFVRELPGLQFHSLFTHAKYEFSWALEHMEEIGPVDFSQGDAADDKLGIGKQFREWQRAGRIIRWLEENSIDGIVLGGYGDAGRLRLIGWARRSGHPCLLWGDSNIRGDLARGIRRHMKRSLLPRVLDACTGVLYCGQLGREYFQSYGVDANRLFPCPCEPDYQVFEAAGEQAREAVCTEYGLRTDRRYFIYSGRLLPGKRVDLLLRAFQRIAEERPDWDLIVVGDGPMRPELERIVTPELRQRVIWTGFINEMEKLAAVYRSADVMVLPSDREAWSVTLFEGALSLALVCSAAVGAGVELVRDKMNGRVFATGDLQSLTDSLRDVSDEKKLADRKSASSAILTQWRALNDPVEGLRRALRAAGIEEKSAAR